ncbi:nucleotidyltransferase domain protein [Ancylostoma ceylanicum]|uniref:Nucleotidyltransferase domain protein n=1 Tax=Ancylostoma ceylanicum TaxID=53326 RepID=A0A0D6M2Y8_9BILA|nr:nucleotidyltransferase domain protein [Ancylostoma ceylanicum]
MQYHRLGYEKYFAEVLLAASSLPTTPFIYDVSYQFSNEFVTKHREQLFQWNSSLLKAHERRIQLGRKNRLITDRYLSKLRSVLANQKRSVVPIGSSVNGLNGKSSDLDVVLITDHSDSKRKDFHEKFRRNEHFRRNQMNAISSLLKNAKLVEPGSLQQILFSNVPILKFKSCDGITVDLQFNNIGPIRSSLFVRTCVQTPTSSLMPNMLSSCPILRPNAPWQEDSDVLILDEGCVYPDISPAEVIVKMIDYYSQIDLHNVSIDICGKIYQRIPDTTEDSFVQLLDPYFPEDISPHARCTVRNGPSLVQQAFSALRSDLSAGKVPKFFRVRRGSATFFESIKARHSKRLEELDKKLEESEKSRNPASNGAIQGILSRLCERVFAKDCRFVQVGSSVNGLHSDNSDVDLVFFPTDVEKRNKFFKDFHNNGDFKMQYIYTMSKLITREVENLGIPVESCVVLHQLRALTPWPVMPVLCKTHANLVGAQIPIDDVVSMLDSPQVSIEWNSHNQMPVSELAVRFIDYYSNFDTSQHVIYIEKGLTSRRRQVSGEVHLLLVDPYSRMTVCRSSAAAKAFAESVTYLRRKMTNGQFLDSFPTFPEASLFRTQTKFQSWRVYARERKVVVDKRMQDQSSEAELQDS